MKGRSSTVGGVEDNGNNVTIVGMTAMSCTGPNPDYRV